MIGIGDQIREGMSTGKTACPGSPAQDGSATGKLLLDLNRSPPVDGGGDSSQNNEALIDAFARASPAAVVFDRSPLAGGEGSQIEAPIAPVTWASPVVVDLDRSPVAGAEGSRHEPPIAAGTMDSPIDVESLVDEGRRNRTVAMRRRRVDLVDLEGGSDQQGRGDAKTLYCRPSGNKRGRLTPFICLSPVRIEISSNQRNTLVPFSRPSAPAPPKEPVFTCPVCLNKIEQPSVTSCGHVFCQKCIKASITAQKKCPTCRKKLGPRGFHRVYLPATTDQC